MALSSFGLATLRNSLPSGHTRHNISGGNAGTAQTIARMRDLVTEGKRDFRVRTAVGKLIHSCPNKDYLCFVQAIHEFCTHKIKYVFDPNGVELIESPYKILESGIADCDSIVVLAAAMAESIGLPAKFVTIKADRGRPNDYSHVYLKVKVPRKGWVALDCTMPDKPFGWEPPFQLAHKDWPASRDGVESHDTDEMAGLGMDVPYVEQTAGVMVGSEWNYRDESALITSSPEELELNPISNKAIEPVGMQRQEFFTKESSPDYFGIPAAAAQLKVSQTPPPDNTRRNQFLAAAVIGAIAFFALKGK